MVKIEWFHTFWQLLNIALTVLIIWGAVNFVRSRLSFNKKLKSFIEKAESFIDNSQFAGSEGKNIVSKLEKVNMILCGEAVEKDGADAEKVGVVSVVYVSDDENKIKNKLDELKKSNPDKFYMEYTTPFDVELPGLGHYPSIEISMEDLQ